MTTEKTDLLTKQSIRQLVQRMGEAADNFLASLAPDQRDKALLSFDDSETRTFWDYPPVPRKGLALGDMDFSQRRLAHQLVAAGLSRSGYVTAATIIGLETTLDAIEGWKPDGFKRDPGLYYVSLFGTPSDSKPWSWRFEGHHISLNYTIVKGQIISPTPTFFGSNPAEAALNGVVSLRPLGHVEDLGRELIRSFDEEQRHTAIISAIPPGDIVTVNQPFVKETHDKPDRLDRTNVPFDVIRYTEIPKGLSSSSMNQSQHDILQALIHEYIHRMPEAIAEIELERLTKLGLDHIHLAWAGGLERHQPHYYRLQGLQFLIEYDNVQNDANHIHTVWRNPSNDFGADLIADHYHAAHLHGSDHTH
jgi:hypothetical protein